MAGLFDYGIDDEENEGQPTPDDSLAGPQTSRDKVMGRIRTVRTGMNEDENGPSEMSGDQMRAMQLGQQSQMTANLGRAANAFAAGTGYKPDNSTFDSIEKTGPGMAMKFADQQAKIKAAIQNRLGRESALKSQMELRNRSLGEQERHNRKMESITGQKILGKNKDIEQLPEDERAAVKALATKNAGKLAIANQIEAVLGNWDSLPDDQKVAQGRQMLKVLNSTEGADAIGVEEAKRLGGKLEFAMGNMFNSNPIQFGRDLPGFKEQASGTAKAMRQAARANQLEINDRYRQYGIARQDPPELKFEEKKQIEGEDGAAYAGANEFTPEDVQALKRAKERLAQNPDDAKAQQVLQVLKGKGLQ